jgi:ATP-dependent exoDNAse (exonuclease V) alpha subunit
MWGSDERGFTIDEAGQSAVRHDRVTARANALHAARQASVEIGKPAFTRADLVEAIGARIPVVDDATPGTVRTQIEALADRVALRITGVRQPHEREGHERYTSAPIITEEAALLALMPARDERAAIPESAVKTAGLSTDQARAITHIATSPWLIQPLSAPAGAGKTTTLKALRAAAHRAGKRRVLVLAPTGKAVDVAVGEGAGDTGYTVAKALNDLRSGALTLDADSLVIVDEAGMVGTPDLRELLTATTNAGTKTVLVGDARQLAPVNARGGMFNQLCDDLPWAQRLSEVWRMRDPAERSASLALRDGGPATLRHAIRWYRQHNRLHTGDPVAMSADALTAWRADRHVGKDALLIADT